MDKNKLRIHFVGVGGVGMGSLAIALSQAGHFVTGSDGKLYEPMKSALEQAKVDLFEGYSAQHAQKIEPDFVVIGNVIRKENPEAQAWILSGRHFCSFPEAVRRFVIQDKISLVCAGTHGKTTTTAWISFLLQELGKDPSYLIGGVPIDLPTGSVLSQGEYFVGEGDEYDSAFFDKGPKFLHYNPTAAIISSVEFDHADIYRDLAHVKESFEKLASLLPGDGVLVVNYHDVNAMEVAQKALCPIQTFGFAEGAMWKLINIQESDSGFSFEVQYKGKNLGEFRSGLFGKHNLMNLLSGIIVASNLGISIDKIRSVVPRYQGVKRRQQILIQSPFVLIDDFAHHPTEVKATLSAIRSRFPERKIWALFEPRSATARRNIHQDAYVESFDSADEVLLSTPFKSSDLDSSLRLSTTELTEQLNKRGKSAQEFHNTDSILEVLRTSLKPNDIVVVMSNGEFDKIQNKILKVSV
jgi:UDP-N-acetylmuramate: L-alanyl-gamma-D-glutamyl-meso-diaminopimelate ligase